MEFINSVTIEAIIKVAAVAVFVAGFVLALAYEPTRQAIAAAFVALVEAAAKFGAGRLETAKRAVRHIRGTNGN
jgi:hypothetical protein